ncbi:MAG TPA: plastocyanin/azurin family copper-binding protein [Thermoleophilaceae bacterium]
MRIRRLLPPVLVLTLGLAAPAVAGEQTVAAVDYEFMPKTLEVQPGDTVTWSFTGDAEHSATSVKGQQESWDSGVVDKGAAYSHTFTKPGRYQYICLPHREYMKGTVQVGEDSVPVSYKGAKTTVRGKRATTRFQLLEAAAISGKLTGPKKKKLPTVTVKRAEAGASRLAWSKKKLAPGSYKGTITFVDDFDKKSIKKVSFKIAE